MESENLEKPQYFSGTFHTPQKEIQSTWNRTATRVFKPEEMQSDEIINEKGLYDKMIMDCAFKEDLKRRVDPNIEGGCDDFFFSLTTNGLCYTFNGKPADTVWEPSTKMDEVLKIWPQGKADKNFGGSGAVQGKTISFWNSLINS